jgi:DNA-binding XRE family transcriptional regulator
MNTLSEVLKQWRWATKLGTREAAKRIGISNSTYSRMERGYPCDGKTLATILTWLLKERP